MNFVGGKPMLKWEVKLNAELVDLGLKASAFNILTRHTKFAGKLHTSRDTLHAQRQGHVPTSRIVMI